MVSRTFQRKVYDHNGFVALQMHGNSIHFSNELVAEILNQAYPAKSVVKICTGFSIINN